MKILIIAFVLIAVLAKDHPEAKLYFTNYCEYYKYPVEYHDVTT